MTSHQAASRASHGEQRTDVSKYWLYLSSALLFLLNGQKFDNVFMFHFFQDLKD